MSKINSITSAVKKVAKLTKWKNEPTIDDLKQNLLDATGDYSFHVGEVKKWQTLLNPPPFDTKGEARSTVVPKLIRKQAEWRYASLSEPFLSSPDIFKVKPVAFEDTFAAYQNELVLNNQFNTVINKVEFIDNLIRTTVDDGTAIVRVGWDYFKETVEVLEPVYQTYPYNAQLDKKGAIRATIDKMMDLYNDPILKKAMPEEWIEPTEFNVNQIEQIQLLEQQAQQLMQQGLKPEEVEIPEFSPVYPARISSQYVTKEKIINRPTVKVCKYTDIVIDPTCTDLSNAEFVIYKFETSIAELKKAGIYKNLDKIEIRDIDAGDLLLDDEFTSFNFKDDARQKFIAYEYWGNWDIDKNKTKKAIVATWVGNTMIRCEENPYPDKALPFVLFKYLPKMDSIYGEPDASLLEDNQKINGAITRSILDLLGKSANSQTGFAKGALDSINKHKFDLGQDYEFNMNVDPRMAIYQHTFPEVPQTVLAMMAIQTQEAENISGIRAYGTGNMQVTDEASATQVKGMLDSAGERKMGILRRIMAGMIQVARKIISMNGEFLSEEEIIRITAEEFALVRRDDLAGNFDLEIDIATNEQEDLKAQELAFMLQTLGQDMDTPMRNLILSEIAKLRKMPELAKRIETYEPKPDPVQQQIMQEQLRNWQLLNAKLEAEIQKLNADAQLSAAKAQTEAVNANIAQNNIEGTIAEQKATTELKQAQAANLQNATASDMFDLQEKISGKDFAKQMRLQSAQAAANLRRDIEKAKLQARMRSYQNRNVGSTDTSNPLDTDLFNGDF